MKGITRLYFMLACLLLASLQINGQGLQTPRVSPPAELKQTIGLTNIVVNYSRPQVKRDGKDRTDKIWGGPAWYGFMKTRNGEIPWRAGANENTLISFSDDVKVQGKSLKAGKYGLHMALSEAGKTTVIFSKKTDDWGSFGYNPAEDALRVETEMQDAAFTNSLTYDFVELGSDYGVLALSWEKKRIPIKIEIDLKTTVLANLRKQLAHGGAESWQATNNAAAYCAQNNYNHEEALKWVNMSIGIDENVQNLSTKAQLLYQTGKQEESIKTSDIVAQKSDINQLNNLGYQMIQIGLPQKAVAYFELNAERNPEDANCYDSLGEGYMAAGDNKKAIKSFKKALSLNPVDNVKQNSLANLEKLGVKQEDKN